MLRSYAESRTDGPSIHSVCPIPDMTLANNGRRAPVPMPGEMFGPAWSIIQEVAGVTSTAPDYAAMGYLAAAASLIGGKRRVKPYATSNWTEPPILWCVALGDPSSRKSSPLEMMSKPLWAIERDARSDHDDALRGWFAEVERAKAEKAKWQDEVKQATKAESQTPPMPPLAVEPEKPHERRTVISDVTPEAAAMVLAGNPQGVLCYNDELQQWFDGFDRYNAGGRSYWLSAYGGRPHSVTRKGSGSIHVEFNGISILGSIQPDKLVPLLAGANDGLVPRLLWAWPDKLPPTIPTHPADLDGLENLYRRLDSLQWGSDDDGKPAAKIVSLSDQAAAMFHEWEKANAASDGDGGSLYEAFVGKMSGTALRFSLVSEMTSWACAGGAEPDCVSARSVAGAIKWIEDYAKPMAQRVYGDAAVPQAERQAALLARYIRKLGEAEVNMRALRLHPHKQHLKPLQDKGATESAFEALVDAGWLMPHHSRDGDNPGQPRKDYRVNPAVLRRGE
jgi:hypothetical protein